MKREIHVAVTGCDNAAGTADQPFRTIQKAAGIARPGDRVIVHEGEYREWVSPAYGGTSDNNRIVYEAAAGEKVVIKGSERISGWERIEGTVWKAVISNSLFGEDNPYREAVFGDWLEEPRDRRVHRGEVYLNGRSFYEAGSLDAVKHPAVRETGYNPPWTKHPEPLLHPEDTVYQWYAKAETDDTIIYANFQGADPNQELTEINVRQCCFYPRKTGRNYITVRGFEMAQAASPWAPPTADQPGLLGVNWSKGWIIENNVIHDAKCSGISIGKEASTGHNEATRTLRKPGYQYQMEAVFKAVRIGWCREMIGSHIIRNNVIYNCGQNAVVGHLGCIFSEIYNNHIYNIGVKQEYFGYEIAGIKLHAPIDVQIRHNNIHDCTLGIWLDWQVQGTRISKNLFWRNERDLMIEVTHGPHLVDNNIFASEYNFDNIAQGGAYVHNLFCGTMRREAVLNRATPYHFPHTTQLSGTSFVYGGDDRWYQNIFIGGSSTYTDQSVSGTSDYDGSPVSAEEHAERIRAEVTGDHVMYEHVKDAVYLDTNAYLNGAEAFHRETDPYISEGDPGIRVVCGDGKIYLEMNIEKGLLKMSTRILNSQTFPLVRVVEAPFDDPCGKAIVFDSDYHNNQRNGQSPAGPFAELQAGTNRVLLWDDSRIYQTGL